MPYAHALLFKTSKPPAQSAAHILFHAANANTHVAYEANS